MHARMVENKFATPRVYANGKPEVITTSSRATCNRRGLHTRHGESSLCNVILLSHTHQVTRREIFPFQARA